MNKQYIIAARPDGLGVRLLTMLNAMYLAERGHLDFKFRWEIPQVSHDRALKNIFAAMR